MGHYWIIPPENPLRSSSTMILTVSWESYSAQVFPTLELVQSTERHHGTELQMRALGSQLKWTLNQEVVFSAALMGKPKKKLYFSQYCWNRCSIGTKQNYASALSRPEWQNALYHGDLPSLQQEDSSDPLIFSPYNNTEFVNVAAYMEAFGATSGRQHLTTTCHRTTNGRQSNMEA